MSCSAGAQVAGRSRVMFLNLQTLQADRQHFDERADPSLFADLGDALRVVSPVVLVYDIDRQEPGRYRLAGHVSAELALTCSRCVEPFTLPVSGAFDLRFVPRTENVGEGEREVREDDLSTAFYDAEQIDLRELIIEQLQLALPMKPLCREDCRGLCAQCGTNLNMGACSCSEKWEDPRLAALKALKKH